MQLINITEIPLSVFGERVEPNGTIEVTDKRLIADLKKNGFEEVKDKGGKN
ncbi:hypothetical protein YTCETSXE_CDS0006 [Staphylococcus phage MVC_VPHSA2]|uniref:Phage protein n=1 Tax=Staphylococcus phage MVC_VPHSA1 TaxID=3088876 RepID=A0ABZ0QYL7_9CAUD|nr:hypothetical protein FBHYGVHD_CDS0026 [Staphylococcus phage MVC_VPHSA1]WPF64962.1 hypothetical protein YTCETSXE_CDS0006 [Staphylococcus phage MVC_VPHSA2]